MVQPAQPAVSAFAAAAAARFASCNLSFTAEPLELDAFIAAGAAAAAAAAPPSDKFDHNEEEDHLEELNPANMRRTSRATNAASVGYARTLSTALETAASTQLADGLVGVSGPQGKAQPFTIIRDPAVWTAKDWAAGVDELIFHVDPAAAAALKDAAAKYIASGAPLAALRKPEDFPLPPEVAARLADVKRELLTGRGVAVLRGLPLDEMEDEAEVLAAYLGVSAHVGQPGPQWSCGRLVTHVTNRGATVKQNLEASKHGPEAFNRNDAFEMHNDSCADVLGLLCIRQAKEGGESAFCSALAVYNEMLRRGRLDLVAVLAGAGFYRDKSRFHQEILPGTSPLWEMPVWSWANGYLTTSYNANLNKQCEERYPELAGKLSPLQKEAMEVFNEIANSDALKLGVRLQRGDVAMINNINVMHSRSTFVDGELPRHLVRVWLLCKDSPHALPKHLTFPRSYSLGTVAIEAARNQDGLFKMLPTSALYVPLSTGERAQ